MPGQLHVVGLKGLRDDLRAIDVGLPVELRKINAKAAKTAKDASQSEASSMGGVQAAAVAGLKASAGQTSSALVIDARKVAFALGAFMGSKRFKQFPEWVGNDWEPGGPGGPYAVGEAMREVADSLIHDYDHAVDRLMSSTGTDITPF